MAVLRPTSDLLKEEESNLEFRRAELRSRCGNITMQQIVGVRLLMDFTLNPRKEMKAGDFWLAEWAMKFFE